MTFWRHHLYIYEKKNDLKVMKLGVLKVWFMYLWEEKKMKIKQMTFWRHHLYMRKKLKWESRTKLMESKWHFEDINLFFFFFFFLGKDWKMKKALMESKWHFEDPSPHFFRKRFENERTILMESRWNFEDINHFLGEKIWKWRKYNYIDGKQMEFLKH